MLANKAAWASSVTVRFLEVSRLSHLRGTVYAGIVVHGVQIKLESHSSQITDFF